MYQKSNEFNPQPNKYPEGAFVCIMIHKIDSLRYLLFEQRYGNEIITISYLDGEGIFIAI